MSRRIRTGFTLVELLVVITIIGILAGLLFPAIQAMRNSARQTECLNNITQVGKGTLNYETSKQRFPGFKNLRPGFPKTTAPVDNNYYIVGWVPPMLTYLGRNDLYNIYSDTTQVWPPLDLTLPSKPTKHFRIAVLTCPADTENTLEAEVQFVPNGGMKDNYSNISPSSTFPPDYLENGISFDQTVPNPIRSSVSYVSSKDGVAMTLMFTENEDADRENGLNATIGWDGGVANSDLAKAHEDWAKKGYEFLNSVIWLGPSDPRSPEVQINKEVENTSGIGAEQFARPFSAHSGGFNVVFCDGHAKFMSDEIDYTVYQALLSADGPNARDTTVNGIKGSAKTIDPLSESQLDK
jgi:prepilin-type N-terminal cleavage/methylation domain-containing protein/prepilin-type processing-associated H-X9-DG protein